MSEQSPNSEDQPGVQKDAAKAESHSQDPAERLPIGAILITSFLALMILISWFGMYFLDVLRG